MAFGAPSTANQATLNASTGLICRENSDYSKDGTCDDMRPFVAYGTDCSDCDPRTPYKPKSLPRVATISNFQSNNNLQLSSYSHNETHLLKISLNTEDFIKMIGEKVLFTTLQKDQAMKIELNSSRVHTFDSKHLAESSFETFLRGHV